VEADEVVDGAGELDDVVDPAPSLGAQLGEGPLVRERLAGEVVVPGLPIVEIILEKVDVRQHMIEDHHVEPVGIVVVVEADRRPGIDDGLVGVVRIQLVLALLAQHFDVVYPVVVHRRDHDLGREFEQIAVGYDVLEGLIAEAQSGVAGALLAPFHDRLGVLVDQLHACSV